LACVTSFDFDFLESFRFHRSQRALVADEFFADVPPIFVVKRLACAQTSR
jgi:hypothetical protein